MTDPLYRSDAYARSTLARVTAHRPEGGVITDPALFYPQGGGQPGDRGWILWDDTRIEVTNTVKDADGLASVLQVPEGTALPPIGAMVTLELDWPTRYARMRTHTALHLLSVVIPLPVTGGQVGEAKGRLDFDMPEVPSDLAAIEAALNDLVAQDLPVTTQWITDEALLANPGLVKTMSVQPPIGQGRVRLVRIGPPDTQVDLQPCGGTHVARTAEIGPLSIGKIEKKGRQNRRVSLVLQP